MKLYNFVKRDQLAESKICMPIIARYGTGGNTPLVLEDKYELCASGVRPVQGNGDGICPENEGLQRCDGSHSRGGIDLSKSVRRLMPIECERLQGMPDDWTNLGDWVDENGKKHKEADSPRYRALGNGIALPFWEWLLGRISDQYDRPATLGSLFDGIASFPLAWSKFNGRENCLWSSEIEQFPIAVAKKHFHEGEETITA